MKICKSQITLTIIFFPCRFEYGSRPCNCCSSMTIPSHCKLTSLICSEGQLGKLEALQFPLHGRRTDVLFVAKARCLTGEFEALIRRRWQGLTIVYLRWNLLRTVCPLGRADGSWPGIRGRSIDEGSGIVYRWR